jgi:hypothetical protein
LKTTQASKSNDREDIRSRFKKAAALADPNSIKFKDVQKALGHYRKSLGAGQAYLKLQKAKLSEKNYKALVAGVNQMMQSDKSFVEASKGINLVFADFKAAWQTILLGVDFENINIETQAATALLGYLEKAVDDPDIKKSAALLSLAEFMLKEIRATSIGDDGEDLLNRLTENAKATAISNQASKAAKNPRGKGKKLTVHIVAAKLNQNKTVKIEAIIGELSTEYGVSVRTVERRIAAAKQDKLVT